MLGTGGGAGGDRKLSRAFGTGDNLVGVGADGGKWILVLLALGTVAGLVMTRSSRVSGTRDSGWAGGGKKFFSFGNRKRGQPCRWQEVFVSSVLGTRGGAGGCKGQWLYPLFIEKSNTKHTNKNKLKNYKQNNRLVIILMQRTVLRSLPFHYCASKYMTIDLTTTFISPVNIVLPKIVMHEDVRMHTHGKYCITLHSHYDKRTQLYQYRDKLHNTKLMYRLKGTR